MNPKKAKIEALLKLSSDLKFENYSISGTVKPVTAADIALLNEFIQDEYGEFTYYDFSPRKNIKSAFRLIFLQDSCNYATYNSYIEHKLGASGHKLCNESDVVYENLYEIEQGKENYIFELQLFIKFIQSLSKKYYQKNNTLIFFSKNYCEVPIQERAFKKYKELAELYKKNSHLSKLLQELLEWISVDSVQTDQTELLGIHNSEVDVIIATEIIENLSSVDKDERIFYLIRNIERVVSDTKFKYSLYIEDFKYSKFVEKINKYSEEFLIRLNKSIADLQSQVLAIPLALPIINFLKDADKINIYTYAAIIIYVCMVFYASCQQAYNLRHISIQLDSFKENTRLPEDLNKHWEQEVKPIRKKISWHKVYLCAVALLIGGTVGICAVNINGFLELIYKVNYLLFFSILLLISVVLCIVKNYIAKKVKI